MNIIDRNKAMAAMEAILFTMGESVDISQFAEVLEIPKEEILAVASMLEEKYRTPDCGLQLRYFGDAIQLSTKDEQFDNLVKVAKSPRKMTLTDTMMETLSIIAYKQPITRIEVESIRGVNSDFAINKLVSLDLVKELGRKDAPGRPLLFGTTEQFLRTFGVRTLDDLPKLNAVQLEEFKEEAKQEVNTRLNI
ncbi:MAG: SMC-Scp complex subunit ScpB [Lachnospiraceae bacterium]|nr:SMC-Scp complex subunit ScpB [Lachnospiraceae bacterium]